MREPTTAELRTARPRLRRFTASVLVLLLVMLPVLVAFAKIEEPVRGAESTRVEHTVFPAKGELTEPARMYYGSMLAEDAPERWAKHRTEITVGARTAGLLALFGISGLVYLLLFLVRGRATAALGCLALCGLPAFASEGHVLRPEQPATLFGLLGVVLIAGFPIMLQERARTVSAWGARASLLLVVGVTFGVARSCHVGAWIYLTIPAAGLLLSVMCVAWMFPRAVRGKSLLYWPFIAASRRYAPWMFLVLTSFALTLLVLGQSGGREETDSPSDLGLLPDSWWLAAPLLLAAIAGALRMGFGVGLRLGRLRRVRPDSVLFLYVAALMMQYYLSKNGGVDRLPAAVAMACLVGDGVMSLAVVGVGQLAKRRAAG